MEQARLWERLERWWSGSKGWMEPDWTANGRRPWWLAEVRRPLLNHRVRPWDGFAFLVHYDQFDDVERHVQRR